MDGHTDGLEHVLSDELTRLTKEEERLDRERETIISQLAGVRRRKDLVKALLGTDEPASQAGAAVIKNAARAAAHAGDPQSGNGRSAADIAFDILQRRGKEPLHYRELADLVGAEGGDLGGPNPAQTLVARMAKD